jgi:hypothetical protein
MIQIPRNFDNLTITTSPKLVIPNVFYMLNIWSTPIIGQILKPFKYLNEIILYDVYRNGENRNLKPCSQKRLYSIGIKYENVLLLLLTSVSGDSKRQFHVINCKWFAPKLLTQSMRGKATDTDNTHLHFYVHASTLAQKKKTYHISVKWSNPWEIHVPTTLEVCYLSIE